MPKFKITKSDRPGKAWKGVGMVNGKQKTIHGGEAKHRGKWGTQGGKTEGQVKSFKARHGEPKSAVQYVNMRNWRDGSQINKTISIPSKFF